MLPCAPLAQGPDHLHAVTPTLYFNGERRNFASLPLQKPIYPAGLIVKASQALEDESRWRHALRRGSGTLPIVILGASVSAGCGAMMPSSQMCAPQHSWARHFAGWLPQLLRGTRWVPRVQVWSKNAVDTSYFTSCLRSKLHPRTQIVLLEFESSTSATEFENNVQRALNIEDLVDVVRKVAPRAAIVFVGWPLRKWFEKKHVQRVARQRSLLDAAINESTTSRHIDVLRMRDLLLAFHTPRNISSHYYGDDVHPSDSGHRFMGEAAARFVAARVLAHSGCSSAPTDSATTASSAAAAASANEDDDAMEPPGQHGSSASRASRLRDADAADGAAAAAPFETCLDARTLPIATTLAEAHDKEREAGKRPWELMNEGGAKHVEKLGLLSRQVGQRLRISPLLPKVRCGLFMAYLGFLQSWRPHQGAFRVTCSGSCRCFAIPGYCVSAVRSICEPLGCALCD